jgi:hypothetical protein
MNEEELRQALKERTMSKEQNKELFFKLFEQAYDGSGYNDPYEYLIDNFEPIMDCSKCPLEPSKCYKYKASSCFTTIKEAIEKGDINL